MADSFVTSWTVAFQASPSMGFPRPNTGVGCHFSSSGDLSDPGIEPTSPVLAGRFFRTEPPSIFCNRSPVSSKIK